LAISGTRSAGKVDALFALAAMKNRTNALMNTLEALQTPQIAM
jgi:hypothetical protein